MTPLAAVVAALRRKILAQPGITELPVCGACQRQVQPGDFGREFCQQCEAERARVSEKWDAQRDADVGNGPVALPSEPMFDSVGAADPFLVEDEDDYAAFIRRLAEVMGRAVAGDPTAAAVIREYDLARFYDVHPVKALNQAETMVRHASRKE